MRRIFAWIAPALAVVGCLWACEGGQHSDNTSGSWTPPEAGDGRNNADMDAGRGGNQNSDSKNPGQALGGNGSADSRRDGQASSLSGDTGFGSAAPSGHPTDAGAVGVTDASPNPTPEKPSIQYLGRWDFSDPANPSASWGPVCLRARFESTTLTIRLGDAAAMAVGNAYEYTVDDGPKKLLFPDSATDYLLASELGAGQHTLEFCRRTEGSYGKTVVRGLKLDSNGTLLAPPARPSRRIEIIGDSISAGFGNEGNNGSSRETHNGNMAFGPQLARMFHAEWSVIAHSGRGMFRNLGEAAPVLQPHMPDEFKLTHFLNFNVLPQDTGSGAVWNFDAWKPDVVLIVLGTNDFAQSGPYPTENEYAGAYNKFLSFLRSVYPKAEIFAVGTFMYNWGAHNQFDDCNAYTCRIVEAKCASGESHIHCVDPGAGASGHDHWLPNATDYINDWTHPTVAAHTIIAKKLYPIVASIMAW